MTATQVSESQPSRFVDGSALSKNVKNYCKLIFPKHYQCHVVFDPSEFEAIRVSFELNEFLKTEQATAMIRLFHDIAK